MGVARARGCFKDVKPIPHLGPKTLTSNPKHSPYRRILLSKSQNETIKANGKYVCVLIGTNFSYRYRS